MWSSDFPERTIIDVAKTAVGPGFHHVAQIGLLYIQSLHPEDMDYSARPR